MNFLPYELIQEIIAPRGCTILFIQNNTLVCKLWSSIIISSTIPINSVKDLKRACLVCDLFSIIRSKCYRYIHKIAEISCISGKLDIYNWLVDNGYEVSKSWVGCYKGGHLELINRFTNSNNIELGSLIAVEKGYTHILDHFQCDAQKRRYLGACIAGDIDAVAKEVGLVTSNLIVEEGVILTCKKGHINLIKWFGDKQLICFHIFEMCYVAAAQKARLNIMEYLEGLAQNNLQMLLRSGLIAACRRNKVEIVKLLLDKGATNYSQALIASLKNGSLECANMVYEKSTPTIGVLNQIIFEVNNIDSIKWVLAKGVTDCRGLMMKLCKSGQVNEVGYLRSYLDDRLEKYIEVAKMYGKLNVVTMLTKC